MQYINALSQTSTVIDWLTNSRYPRVLHVFDRACNLINEKRNVLSIVTPENSFSIALVKANISTALIVISRLAGLGIGLTPAGDDFIMGGLYGAWISHPLDVAERLAQEIAETAAPLTTSLSAEWLRSAGRGVAGIGWHEFFDVLLTGSAVEPTHLRDKVEQILEVGETSGADALAGFVGTLIASTKVTP